MKIKRLLAAGLALVLCLVFTACIGKAPDNSDKPDDADQPSTISPLLYEVTDPETGHRIWLFGSIHMGKKEFYPLPDYVMDAFDEADYLAVEFDILAFEKDLVGQMNALSALVYTDGTTIRDHISEETYTKAVKILKDNHMYSAAFDNYLPVFWQSMITNLVYKEADADPKWGVDRHMIREAYDQGKDVLGIESAEEQYEIMAGFSEELQAVLLEDAVRQYAMPGVQKLAISLLLSTWQKGDAAMLDQLLNGTDESEISVELYAEYMDAMITQRNLSMTAYAEDLLLTAETEFICVGAAHIVGDGAMADLLEEYGYTVRVVGAKS